MSEHAERWIIIPRWDDFQHYKDRTPVWIKMYTRLLDDPRFLRLTAAERGLLITLWLLYAKSDGSLPLDPRLINTWSNLTAKMHQYESLNHAGFIRISASKPLAQSKRKREKEPRAVTPTRNVAVENGEQPQAIGIFENLLRPMP